MKTDLTAREECRQTAADVVCDRFCRADLGTFTGADRQTCIEHLLDALNLPPGPGAVRLLNNIEAEGMCPGCGNPGKFTEDSQYCRSCHAADAYECHPTPGGSI